MLLEQPQPPARTLSFALEDETNAFERLFGPAHWQNTFGTSAVGAASVEAECQAEDQKEAFHGCFRFL